MDADAFEPAARRREILEARARQLAAVRQVDDARREAVLAFHVGGERYAVPLPAVVQVVEAKGLAPLPASPPWLLGALVARTRIVPVLDLRQVLGLEGGGMSDLAKVVVVEEGGEAFGIAAEALEGQVEVPLEGRARPASGPFVWIAADRLALLDLAALGTGEPG